MIAVNVMYPNQADSTFNWDYYLSNHLDLVKKCWGPMGLKGARVIKGVAGDEPDSDAPYLLIAQVLFDTVGEFEAAAAAHGEAIFGDVPNFTNIAPEVQVSEVLVDM